MPADYLEFLVDAFGINRDDLVPGDKHLNLEDLAEYLNLSGSLEPLQLQTNGSGSIQVNTVTPDFSGGTWNGQYYSDFPVTLTAVPSNVQTFIGWSGDYDSTDTTITVSLQDAMQIQANFSNGNT